jgi:hypothetical protein
LITEKVAVMVAWLATTAAPVAIMSTGQYMLSAQYKDSLCIGPPLTAENEAL